jgi:MEMO1 family protein
MVVMLVFLSFREEEKMLSSQIRQPTVAGRFYPDDPQELAQEVDSFLSDKGLPTPKIIIVPHAAYAYSGPTAGIGFTQLKNEKRVILVGTSHRAFFKGAAIYDGDGWQTPLGKVSIDTDVIKKLVTKNPHCHINNDAHSKGHGLEVQLPFLQRVLDEFKIIPILLNQTPHTLIKTIGDSLAAIMDEDTVLVVSSDLSHYPSQADAEIIDRQTIDTILSGDTEIFRAETIACSRDIPNLSTCACGADAIKVGMRVARKLRLGDIRLLQYSNSGQVSGDSSRVVGYAAIGFYPP